MPPTDTDTEGRYSVAFPKRWWYPACPSGDLGSKPLAVSLMDTPIVLFRDGSGAPHALLDRCPHRNYPLSLGRCTAAGTLECGYHGWQFDGAGACRAVPGLHEGDAAASENRTVPAHAAVERDGFVWVWGEPDAEPVRDPFELPTFQQGQVGRTVFAYDLDCTMHAALENALDVPHTAFLHRGIFRGSNPKELTAVRRDVPDGVEAQYLGERVGFGPFQPGGTDKTFDHWDRFFLPCVAQVEYAVEGWFRIVNTILHLPLSPFRTRAWFVVQWSSPVPAAVLKPAVLARGKQILRQDARALEAQTERMRRFGGERYTSTELDILGNAIWRLLRRAERAEAEGDGTVVSIRDATDGDAEPAETDATVTFKV